jgi:exodeoxyribonuclease V alpha subunit
MIAGIRLPTVPPRVSALEPWVTAGVFGAAEIHAAEVLTRSGGEVHPLVQLAAALALGAPLRGDSCVDLATVRATIEAALGHGADGPVADAPDAVATSPLAELAWPDVDEWLPALRASPTVRSVNRHEAEPPLDHRALVLDDTRLYTQRQWVDECSVAAHILARARASSPEPLSPAALELLDELLPPFDDDRPNAQHEAARAAFSSRLSVIVGGPGTGKTHTVARLLAVLVEDSMQRGAPFRVGLAAPTGKAAARMNEALTAAAESLPVALATRLNEVEAFTVHRLLGWRPGTRTRFAHDRDKPLPYDIVVIDETSMVAMPLLARLLEATPADARLVLVGDPDQLESIEVGAVLADVVGASSRPGSPLDRHVTRLTRPRRLDATSPIGPLADAIRENRPNHVLARLRSGDPAITFLERDDPLSTTDGGGVRDIVLPPLTATVESAREGSIADALAGLARIRVVCAHRRGPHGAEAWNRAIESWLFGGPPRVRFYPGRALLATRNDLKRGISNGDTGVVVATEAGPQAAFMGPQGINVLSPAQLEDLETSFATTIHKSQGSEYPLVVVILPPATSPILGRELLYTAVTRTTSRLVVVGTEAAISAAVQTPSRRVTGLAPVLASGELS